MITDSNTRPCRWCDGTMALVRHFELKDMPEIYIFYCSRCQHTETVKLGVPGLFNFEHHCGSFTVQ